MLRRVAAGLPAGAPVLVVADRHHLYPEIAALAGPPSPEMSSSAR